jgi:filamentous hemagglutinin
MSNLFQRIVSSIMVCLLIVQPTLLAAQTIQVVGPDNGPRPRVDSTYNGTDVINIAKPNGAGVSHDIFSAFTADDLILNNSATSVNTQLGGWVEGNPNLVPGQVAGLWIGEVMGGSETQLNGILEVAGQSMDVVLANEFGITCKGCGFINTGRATLTTGTPRFASTGGLVGFDVRQGTVTVGAAGLNPQSRLSFADTSRVDVISRAAMIYGAMRADQLNVVAGANVVDYDWSYNAETGAVMGVTEQAGRGAAPALAVDVAALGGMYANAIQMVATENGVGVGLAGEMASSTNIALRADGKLTLAAPNAGHVPQIKARERILLRNQGPLLLEGSIASENGNLIDIRTTNGALSFIGGASGGAVILESAGDLAIYGAVKATNGFRATSHEAALTLDATAEVAADSIELGAATDMTLAGKVSANGAVYASAGGQLVAAATFALAGSSIDLAGNGITTAGIISADALLRIVAGTDGASNSGTLSGATLAVMSSGGIANSGGLIASQVLALEAAGTVTNAATLISGNDLTIYADQILNNGGVIWANDSIALAANANLDPASLVQNTGGRIEAFQGDLVIRADEVLNLGTAPTIGAREIIKWVEQGTADQFDPVAGLTSLINPAYLGANGAILPAYAAAYTELWSGVINGGTNLSSAAQGLLRPEVLTSSGTALKSELAGRWGALTGKANEVGTPDPAAHTASMVNPAYLDANGTVLPAHVDAYAALWIALASGQTIVTDQVKAIINPAMLEIESQTTDPATGVTTTLYSNQLKPEATDVWTAMLSGSNAAYDIIKILNQDRFNDDGKLAELIAGGTVDIKADTVSNIFGRVSAGEDILITSVNVTNKAMGASQLLLEVHKKPGCFTCHEGEVDFYDTFGGRMEAVGNVAISGNLTNVTLNSSQLSLQDVMDEMNAYIAAQQAKGDPDLTNVPAVMIKNFHLSDTRNDSYSAPVNGNGLDIRTVIPVDTGSQTPVDVAPAVTPTLSPTASLDELLAAGLNTLAETTPEFTSYANYITSNYMMDVDRLQYRDNLVNNTSERNLAAPRKSNVVADLGELEYLNQPIRVPAADGSGSRAIYPAATKLELNTRGALIRGASVTISGGAIHNAGAIAALGNVSITANTITGSAGSIVSDAGAVALTALASMSFEDTQIDGDSVDIIAGQDFVGKGVSIKSKTDASIFAITGVTLTSLEHEFTRTRSKPVATFFGLKRTTSGSTTVRDQLTSSLKVGGNLSIITSGDLTLAGLQGNIGGDTNLSAGGNLLLTAVDSTSKTQTGNSANGTDISTVTSHVTELNTGGDFLATAGASAILVGTQIGAGGTVQLAAAENVILAAAQEIYSFEDRKSESRVFGLIKSSSSHKVTNITNKGVRIAAMGDVDVIAETGKLATAGTAFVSNNGDINLSAVAGEIYAGVYTDIFKQEHQQSSSFLFGLVNASSTRNTINQLNTGTDALAALDLSIVSGADTTLVGAKLAAGKSLNINTVGDFSVQAAIDSQRSELFSQDMGLITMTTIQERSFVETAVFTQLLAGQALNLSIGGAASLTLFDQAGVDAPAPENLYPEELLALAGLQLLSGNLANEYFYDKQVQLSPAFKALLTIIVTQGMGLTGAFNLAGNLGQIAGVPLTATAATGATTLTWAGSAINAFGTSFLVNSVDGVVSGNFDLGAILEGAVFSGVSAGLTAGININLPEGHPLHDNLIAGFGSGQFTMAGLLEAGLDGVVSSGLSSAVYGTDFGDGVLASLVSYIADGVAGAGIEEIADVHGHDVFSVEKLVAKATLNCLAAEAKGASCASGAVGSLMAEFATEYSKDTGDVFGARDPQEYRDRLQLIAAVAGYFTSGGEGENVYATMSAALMDYDNNCGPCVFIIPAILGALTAADYALTASDAYDLAQEGLACDAGDQAACNRVSEMAVQFGVETSIEMTVGQIVPGSKVGMKIIAMMRKKGDDDFVKAVDDAVDKYTGGAHRDTKRPSGDGLESHHCPAQACYKDAKIGFMDGPAIKMDPADHALTSSYKNSKVAAAYRAKQQKLLNDGKLEEAIQMDIDDIRRIEVQTNQVGKYDQAIQQMKEYARTLDPNEFKSP